MISQLEGKYSLSDLSQYIISNKIYNYPYIKIVNDIYNQRKILINRLFSYLRNKFSDICWIFTIIEIIIKTER